MMWQPSSDSYYSLWSFLGLGNLAIPYLIGSLLWIRLFGLGTNLERKLPVPPSYNTNKNDKCNNNKNDDNSNTDDDDDDDQEKIEKEEKIAIVTGSNTGIGYETAKCLVLDYGYTVVLACRSREKGQRAVESINSCRIVDNNNHTTTETTENKNTSNSSSSSTLTTTTVSCNCYGKAIFLVPLDLSSFESVRTFCNEIKTRFPNKIHLLVNNAGLNIQNEISMIDQLDLTFQTNFIGHFLLTCELMNDIVVTTKQQNERSKSGSSSSSSTSNTTTNNKSPGRNDKQFCAGGRIVNLSSVMHHFCHNDNNNNNNNNNKNNNNNNNNNNSNNQGNTTSSTGSFHNIEFWKEVASARKPGENKRNVYSLSKLAAILFSIELNKRYGSVGIRSIAVNPGAVNSDIWRELPNFIIKLFNLLYLNVQQGCRTSVAASILHDTELPLDNDHCCYLQPYWIPFLPITDHQTVPFPMYEMLGPFQGYRIVKPRLPSSPTVVVAGNGHLTASEALWKACEEITGCTWPEMSQSIVKVS